MQDNDLSQPVNDWLASTSREIPLSRVLFIKQPPRKSTESIVFYVAVTDEMKPQLYRFQLKEYEDLFKLDIPAIVAGDPVFRDHLDEELLYLICTNGERDLCCARRGIPIYKQMVELEGERVWQCTHLGGHRFATNCLFMPFGIYYGQVDQGELKSFVSLGRSKKINLEHYRGRSHYDVAGQVGEYFLREQTGVTDIAHFRLEDVDTLSLDRWTVRFVAPKGETHAIDIERALSDWEEIQSCGKTEKKRVPQFRMVAYQVAPGHGSATASA